MYVGGGCPSYIYHAKHANLLYVCDHQTVGCTYIWKLLACRTMHFLGYYGDKL